MEQIKQKAIEKIKNSNLKDEEIHNTINHIKEWYVEDLAEEQFYKKLVEKFPFLKSIF